MFTKILIANRGEIACRIARTARRMDVRTVAVYSDADALARHVTECDEAVRIGSPPALESYLRIDAILEAARRTGAQAIHPGYGFLSENADFAEACVRAGIVFIGPPAQAIRDMGSKSRAKALMEQAGVPLLPGYHGQNQDPEFLEREAERVGYPLLIKASAGGGGKGLRVVERREDFQGRLESCRREAKAAFGDENVLLEKLLMRARHVEMQIFADQNGRCIPLYERDCSAQRRHQKVLEEAPAPNLSEALRRALADAAVSAAMAVGYEGAGTIEFLLAPTGDFYFLEMNTRLQVEHPVTEMITGLDLVEWQLRVAAGEPLPEERAPEAKGHAIEARIYAEDPYNGFLPSTGRLVQFAMPEPSAHVRIDAGVRKGDEITTWYDPLIAKLIVWDSTREAALARLHQALAQVHIVGVANNVELLSRLVATSSFSGGKLDTAFMERERESLFAVPREAPEKAFLIAALAVLIDENEQARLAASRTADPFSPWHAMDGWRLNGTASRPVSLKDGSHTRVVNVRYVARGYELEWGGRTHRAHGEARPENRLRVELDGAQFDVTAVLCKQYVHVFLEGCCHVLARDDALPSEEEESSTNGALTAPLPGRIVALLSEPGMRLAKGTPLLVLEAMKMEHTLCAPATGTLTRFRYGIGAQVLQGAQLVDFDFEAPRG